MIWELVRDPKEKPCTTDYSPNYLLSVFLAVIQDLQSVAQTILTLQGQIDTFSTIVLQN